MSSLPNQRSSDSAAAVLVFLVALPLLAIVAAIFIAALVSPLHEVPENAMQIDGMRDAAPDRAMKSAVAEIEPTRSTVANESPEPTQQPVPPPVKSRAEPSVARQLPSSTETHPPPWQSALDLSDEPAGYEKLAFLSFDDAFGKPGREDLSPWFEATAHAGFRLSKVPSQFGQSGTMEGIGRLLCPWPDGAVLWLQLENFDELKMHFWNGSSGATLVYYDEGNRWAAYKTSRDGDEPTPKKWAIAATDDDRCRRSGFRFGGPIEIRFANDELMLSRGDLVLLSASFYGRPADVFFDGRATIHGIALDRTKDAPKHYASRSAKEGNEQKFRPADLDWKTRGADGHGFERLANGSVWLSGSGLNYAASLPESGPHEVVLELSDVEQGAGVYLSDEAGRPGQVLRFCRDRKTARLVLALRDADQSSEIDRFSPDESSVPLVESHCWVKLLQGCGNVRWWVSTDGVHWAQTEPAKDNTAPGLTRVGLSLAVDSSDSQITLKQVVLRPLSGLQSLAGGSTREMTYPHLEMLLDDAEARGVAFNEQLAALDDAALMCLDLRDNAVMKLGILSRYARLGLWAADHDGLPAWSSVRPAFHSVPVCSPLQSVTECGRAVRWELVSRAYQRQSEQMAEFIERLRLFHEHRASGLVDWAQWSANSNGGSHLAAQPKESWRELLVEELSKDAYNAVTELKAVLDGQSWEEAARLIAGLRPERARGVAPAMDDGALLSSLPVAIANVITDFPQVADAIADKLVSTAKFRIAEAIRAGDGRAIELAAVQFATFPASADAQRWLGDRALAAGHFSEAIKQYERASRCAPELASELAPKMRLAAAMSWREMGEPIAGSTQLGDVTVSAADYEALIAEMRAKHVGDIGGEFESIANVPRPGRYVAAKRSQFDGPAGERLAAEVAKRPNEYRVPWVDRQLAVTVDGGVAYVSNRFQVAAYELADGRRIWQSKALPHTLQRAQDWPLIPMRPVVHREWVFARLLYSSTPILACHSKSNGELVWTAETSERESLVSDPLVIHDRIVVLSLVNTADQTAQLRQLTIDAATGDVIGRHDLIRLRGNWSSRRCCQVTLVDGGYVATLGGVTLASSVSGDVRWIRKHVTIPADGEPRGILQMYDRPLVSGSHLFVAQPGVRTIECLETVSGRQQWQVIMPEVIGIVGVAGEILVVRTETDLRGVDALTGEIRWRQNSPNLVGFPVCDEHNVLFANSEAVNGSGERKIKLTWLKADDGHLIAAATVERLADADPQLGPLVSTREKTFTFFGRGGHDLTREVIELVSVERIENITPKTSEQASGLRPGIGGN